MGFYEEEKQTAPPPRWWPAAQKKNAHGVKEIVYDRSFHATHHTKDRHREQEEVYHKKGRGATPDGQAARDAWHRMERLREQLDHNIDAHVRTNPLDPMLYMATRAQALSIRRENDDRRGNAGQGHSLPEDVLQPHRGRRHGRFAWANAIPSGSATKTAAAGARGKDRPWKKAAEGQAERGLGGKGARALGDGHGHIKERLKRRAPCDA